MARDIAKLIHKPENKVEHQIHRQDQFLELSLEQLLIEPVVLEEDYWEGKEGEVESVPEDLVIDEDEFLDLEFEALFDIPVRIARLDTESDADASLQGDVTSQAAGSGFLQLNALNDNDGFDNSEDLPPIQSVDPGFNDGLGDIVTITTQTIPDPTSVPVNNAPSAPLFYIGELQEDTGPVQTITGNLGKAADNLFAGSFGAGDGLANVDVFFRPGSGAIKQIIGGTTVLITTIEGNTFEIDLEIGAPTFLDYTYTLNNPYGHEVGPNNLPPTPPVTSPIIDEQTLVGLLSGNPATGVLPGDIDIGQFFYDIVIYTVTDVDGDVAVGQIAFRVLDDVPVAVPDTGDVNETLLFVNGSESLNGNVLNNDDPGMDGAVVLSVNGVVDGGVGDVDGKADGVISLASAGGVSGPFGTIEVNTLTGEYDYDLSDATAVSDGAGTVDDIFDVVIVDGDGDTSATTLTITVDLNQAPQAKGDSVTTDEDTPLNFDVLADNGSGVDTDPDGVGPDTQIITKVNGSAMNVGKSIALGSGILTVNANGTASFDPDDSYEALDVGDVVTLTFTYTLADAEGLESTATVNLQVTGVNDPPVAQDDAVMTNEDTTLMGQVFNDNGSGADEDPDDPLNVVEVNGVPGDVGSQIALSSGALLTQNADGTFEYDPNGAFETLDDGEQATDTYTYKIEDDNGATSTATVTVTIDGVNDAPVAKADAVSTDEDAVLMGDVFADNGSGIDDDVDGDTISVSAVNGTPGDVGNQIMLASGALLTLNSDGTFDYDPNGAFDSLDAGDFGSDTFTYTITDGDATDTTTVTVTINGIDSPPIAQDDAVMTDEDSTLMGQVLDDNGNGVDSDPESGALTITEVNGVSGDIGSQIALTSGALLTLNSDGTFDYDPNGAFEALADGEQDTDSFTYTLSDSTSTDTATVTVTIDGVNDDPVAVNDNYTLPGLGTANEISGNVITDSGTDSGGGVDSDVDTSDMLTVTEVNGMAANVGMAIVLASGATATIMSDGSLSYDASALASTTDVSGDSLTYTLSDGTTTDMATVSFSGLVTPVVFDMNSDGQIELVGLSESTTVLDHNEDGVANTVGWIGKDEGILMYDIGGDREFTQIEEIALAMHHEDAQTDLEGLALAFDSNQDGVFDTSDAQYDSFGVWQDSNQNAILDEGEFKTLSELEIISVSLDREGDIIIDDSNIIYGQTTFTKKDGTIGLAEDIAFGVGETQTASLTPTEVLQDVDADTLGQLLASSLPQTQDTASYIAVEEMVAAQIVEISYTDELNPDISHQSDLS